MPRSQMISAVVQTVFLIACRLIISHNLHASAEGKLTNNDLYKNWTQAMELAGNTSKAINHTTPTIDAGPLHIVVANDTGVNSTLTNISVSNSEESFYWETLPREVFACTIIAFLGYYWQIWLERTFPARPRPSEKVVSEKFAEQDDESREEEVVKKWIAQGKIRRASLSWWNTFVKWVLDVVIGGLWMASVHYLLVGLLKMKPSPKVLLKSLKMEVLLAWGLSLFGSRPLASLVALSIIPAHKRIVFVAGMDLAFWTFIGFFVNLVIPWFATTEFARDVVGNMTEGLRNGTLNAHPRLSNEL
ncbi:hypothetical protein N431DRAFT_439043 [Stipitochalara longipes BDJ]|nr:hypothetical protein N431DRAFT_439043 [Stipitochalara longipes BDJ]